MATVSGMPGNLVLRGLGFVVRMISWCCMELNLVEQPAK